MPGGGRCARGRPGPEDGFQRRSRPDRGPLRPPARSGFRARWQKGRRSSASTSCGPRSLPAVRPPVVRAGRSVQPRIQLERGRRRGPRPCRPGSAGAAQRDGRADLGRGPVPAGRYPARHLAPRPGAVRELCHGCSDSLRRTVPRPPAARSLPAPCPLLAALERAEPVALPVAAMDAVEGRMGSREPGHLPRIAERLLPGRQARLVLELRRDRRDRAVRGRAWRRADAPGRVRSGAVLPARQRPSDADQLPGPTPPRRALAPPVRHSGAALARA